jgi:hypothetical protein
MRVGTLWEHNVMRVGTLWEHNVMRVGTNEGSCVLNWEHVWSMMTKRWCLFTLVCGVPTTHRELR